MNQIAANMGIPLKGPDPNVSIPDASSLKDAKAKIADNLKRAFDDVANEPVPDELLRLLNELAEKEKDG